MTIAVLSTIFVSLFALLNPLSVAAIFLSMSPAYTAQELKVINMQYTLAVAIIMMISIWMGHLFLLLFGLNLPAFQGAGGLILIIIGIGMILPKIAAETQTDEPTATAKHTYKPAIAVVPLAIPLTAGPGCIALIIATAERYSSLLDKGIFTLLTMVLAILCGIILRYAPSIGKHLGDTGLKTLGRTMGLIITAIGFNMLAIGIGSLFPGLGFTHLLS